METDKERETLDDGKKCKERDRGKQQAEAMSQTPYDDVHRTLLNDCPQLIIPVVNEAFHKDYDCNEEIIVLNNNFYLTRQDGEQNYRITDTNFRIRDTRYHIECQSSDDGTMIYRIFEYDSQMARQESMLNDHHLIVTFPKTAVLYLRHSKNTPDEFKITIRAEGSSCTYSVPIIKVQKYTLDEIFERNLLFLIPFHIFVYEKDFGKYETDERKREKLENIYRDILRRLKEEAVEGRIDEYTRNAIVDMSKKVIKHLTKKNKKIKERLGEVMGGRILDYPAKDILNRGKALGLAEGLQTGRREGLAREIATLIECFREFGRTKDDAIQKLIAKYELSKQEAEAKVAECWG